MQEDIPPWIRPAVCAPGAAGAKYKGYWQTIGNGGAQSQRLWGGFSALRSFGCMANHGKPWDAKSEAKGRFAFYARSIAGFLCVRVCKDKGVVL